MKKKSKTGAKATAAAAAAKKAHGPVAKAVDRNRRKLLEKNSRKAKARALRQGKPNKMVQKAVLRPLGEPTARDRGKAVPEEGLRPILP